jgi:hypothetical protein
VANEYNPLVGSSPSLLNSLIRAADAPDVRLFRLGDPDANPVIDVDDGDDGDDGALRSLLSVSRRRCVNPPNSTIDFCDINMTLHYKVNGMNYTTH